MKTTLEDYLERGEIVYLDRHIARLETKLADTLSVRDNIALEARDLRDTLHILKKIQSNYESSE